MTSLDQGPRQDGKIAIHALVGASHYIWIGERDDEEEDTEPSITLEARQLDGARPRHNEALEESSFAKGSTHEAELHCWR